MMKFKINNREWEIIELSQEEIKTIQNKRRNNEEEDLKSVDTRYFGLCLFDCQTIYLDKDLHDETKKQSLRHELMHCYINVFINHEEMTFSEEMICNISANSHDIINEIVEEYFKGNK